MSALALRHATPEPAWQDIDVAIDARFVLESGDVLTDARVRVRRYGSAEAPQVIALGGISAGRCVCDEGGWWSEIAGAGGALDTERYGVIGIDFAPIENVRLRITPRDQARLIVLVLDALRIERLHAFVGASYGGMVGLAFAALAPSRLRHLFVISASNKPSALGLAWRGVQRRIVEFGLAHGDAEGGLALARQLAMTTYRTPGEFEDRFGAGVGHDGVGEVDRYLVARGEAYPRTMAPERWLSLSEAIDRHQVDPVAVTVPTTLVACPDDQLVPFADVQALAEALPKLAGFHSLASIYGHDAFLKEAQTLRPILIQALEKQDV